MQAFLMATEFRTCSPNGRALSFLALKFIQLGCARIYFSQLKAFPKLTWRTERKARAGLEGLSAAFTRVDLLCDLTNL